MREVVGTEVDDFSFGLCSIRVSAGVALCLEETSGILASSSTSSGNFSDRWSVCFSGTVFAMLLCPPVVFLVLRVFFGDADSSIISSSFSLSTEDDVDSSSSSAAT